MDNDPESTLIRTLYDEHAAALWRYAVRLNGDQARAEDVVQETLLKAWQHPEVTEDNGRSARAWLYEPAKKDGVAIPSEKTVEVAVTPPPKQGAGADKSLPF